MRALICNSDGVLSVEERPNPEYTSKMALVKTISCGICGTDGHVIEHKFKGVTKEMYPLMLGHEAVGRVIETGDQVTSFKPGDIVILSYVDADTNPGGYGSAWGSFCEYGVIHDAAAYEPGQAPEVAYGQKIIPPDIDPVDAAMIVTFREVLSNIRYFKIQKNEPIVVFGCGPVGLTFIKFLQLLGMGPIIAVARNLERQQNALDSGADIALNSTECNIFQEIRKLYPYGVPYVLDAAGSENVINDGMKLICDRGKILCYGVPKTESLHIDFSEAPYNWNIIFQQMPRKDEEGAEHELVLKWLRNGDIHSRDYISDYYKFDDILQAFEDYKNKRISKKGIVVYD